MDMKISGCGKVPAGEYDVIKISGCGELCGHVKCASLHVSGVADAESLECWGDVHVSGTANFDKDILAGSLHISGALNCDSNVHVQHEAKLSGGINIDGELKCGALSSHGGLNVEGDIEAETASIYGTIVCTGLLNAEQIKIDTKSGCLIGSIGGSKITITYTKRKIFPNLVKMQLNGKHVKGVKVEQAIEGDEIDIKYVTCPRVSGRTVKVGEGCDIAVLQYSESYEIDPKAKVGKIERI